MAKAGTAAQARAERQDSHLVDNGRQHDDADRHGGDRRRDDEREPAAADEKAAQQRELLMLGIFGDEALRRRAEPDIADAADQQQPGPGINVNAEFEAAEPARQHDLRHEGQERGDDADDEGGTGETPHQRRIAAAGKQRTPACDRAVELRLPRGQPMRTRRLLGTDRCHNDLCATDGATLGKRHL